MSGEFKKRGISIERFYFCPHHPEATVKTYRLDCSCRKPKPGMFERAARELNIDIAESLVIGDKPSDRITLPGLRSIIVKSKYTGDDYDVDDLSFVADYL